MLQQNLGQPRESLYLHREYVKKFRSYYFCSANLFRHGDYQTHLHLTTNNVEYQDIIHVQQMAVLQQQRQVALRSRTFHHRH